MGEIVAMCRRDEQMICCFFVLWSRKAIPLTTAQSEKGARKSPGERRMGLSPWRKVCSCCASRRLGYVLWGELFTYLPALNIYY